MSPFDMAWRGIADRIAGDASAGSGLLDRPNADPLVLAVSYLGLRLAPCSVTRPRLVDGCIHYPRGASEDARAYYVGHECGHELLRLAGHRLSHDDEERAASRIGCALLLPRVAFARDVASLGWDVPALRELWPLASAWVVARRITETEAAVAIRRTASGRRAETVTSDGLTGRESGDVMTWPLSGGGSVQLVRVSRGGA